jgi:hypothetical protein
MVKHATTLPDASPPREAPAPDGLDDSLERRVRRLEDAVANLQDTAPLEDRIVERVSDRLGIKPAPPPPAPERTEYMISAERRTVLPPPEERRASLEPQPPPATAAPPSPPAPSLPLQATLPSIRRYPWLLFDLLGELRTMFRMFFDVRYHVGWSARVTVLILLPLIFTSYYWVPFSSVFLVGTVIEKTVDLLLAFLAYKALSREARRYQELKGNPYAKTG